MSDINRRNFIQTIFRFGMTGGLVTLGIVLSSGSEEADSVQIDCKKPSPCQQCNQLKGCTQPRAIAYGRKISVMPDSIKTHK